MPFVRGTFLGLSVRDWKSGISYGSGASTLTVALVADPLNGDAPAVPPHGTPCSFQFYGFRFQGLLQKFAETKGPDGLPLYEATLVDPREILAGAKLITAGYAQAVTVPNLLNVYGYWENQAFGASQSTPAGMPWDLVKGALAALCNQPLQTAYGGPLTYRGVSYGLDLSELPSPPAYYRLPAGSLSLLDAVQILCEDASCDFFVELTGLTIKVRTVGRFLQPPLGTLSALALSSTFAGNVVRVEAGVEARNETTSAMLVGGEKTAVSVTDRVVSYWGTDVAGRPIVGTPQAHPGGLGVCDFMNLNAADCADIVGDTFYPCSTVEMRAALGGPETWGVYVDAYKTNLAAVLGNASLLGNKNVPFAPNQPADLVRDDAQVVQDAADDFFEDRRLRLYGLVRRAAEDFYGKQFLVKVPDVRYKVDAETGRVTSTAEPSSSGYLKFGAAALGVPANRLDVLQDADERVLPFAYFESVVGSDTSRVNWNETAVDVAGRAWVRASVSPRIIPLETAAGTVASVHLRLGSPLFDSPPDEYGGVNEAGKVFGPNVANPAQVLRDFSGNAFGGTFGHFYFHPAARTPKACGVPLKSNVETYGPWVVAGAPGAVRYEQDPSLTPWDYGSEAVMDFAGLARVSAAVSNQQVSEAGQIVVAGPPAYNLGDTLQAGGPNLTNVEATFGPQGVTTSYRFATFTPRFGVFSRQNAERLKRAALAEVDLRRQLRKALNKAAVASEIVARAVRGAKANVAFWKKKQSPHTVIGFGASVSGGDTRVNAGTETYEAGLVLLNTGDNFTKKAMTSWTGLVRGFSTNPTGTDPLPKYIPTPAPFGGTNAPVLTYHLNPFKSGHDVEVVTSGRKYAGAHAYHRGSDENDTRAVCLRGPLVLAGWGYGTDGKCYPGGGASFPAGYLRKSETWPVGAVDHLWDPKRGVWTSHDLMSGTAPTGLPASGTGVVWVGGSSGWTVTVKNPWSAPVSSGVKVHVGYMVNEHAWHVTAADCG
jgi:hypothetical protein